MTSLAPAMLWWFAVAGPTDDVCALRPFVHLPSKEVAARLSGAEGRERACWTVVLAQALAREGDGAGAVRLLDQGAPGLPELTKHLQMARARFSSRISAPRADPPAPTTAAEATTAIQRLISQGRAREAADLAIAFPRANLVHEALEIATVTALVRAERFDDAVARARALPPSDEVRLTHAWTLSRAGRHEEARDVYDAAAAASGARSARGMASFLAAFATYELGELEQARGRFASAAPVAAGTRYEISARWYQALVEWLLGRPEDAATTLRALVQAAPTDREVLKHRYWLARARLSSKGTGAREKGEAELVALASQDPTDYYGLLARRRLGHPPLRGAAVHRDALARQARSDAPARAVMLAWQLGLDDEARSAGRALGTDLETIGLQHAMDDAHHGWRQGGKHAPVPRVATGAVTRDARWRVSYATPWSSEVEKAAQARGVPASFIYAIMRTESGFDPIAVSPAGARGVLQLMPAVARGLIPLAARPKADAERVFEPRVAIDLGAALLGRLTSEFGSKLLAAAAYNGGPQAVVAWLTDQGGLETELFVERIPFKETRDYVKRVLAAEATYRALDGGELSLDLPATLPPPPATVTAFPAPR